MKAQAAPKNGGGDHAQSQQGPHRQALVECQPHQSRAEAADIGLALAADVEQAGMERNGDRQAGEDEIGRVVKRVADAVEIAEGAGRHGPDHRKGILMDRPDQQAGDDQRHQQVDHRQAEDLEPAGHGAGSGNLGCCTHFRGLIFIPGGRAPGLPPG